MKKLQVCVSLLFALLAVLTNGDDNDAAIEKFSCKHICPDGHCIRQLDVCNRRNDCGDWSDEFNCNCSRPGVGDVCATNGQCLDWGKKCNGVLDCADGSDEANCSVCGSGKFHCDTTHCIDNDYLCNNKVDCVDGSDENEANCPCNATMFHCDLSKCLPMDAVCDGDSDCKDKTDEASCSKCNGDAFHCDGNRCLEARNRCDFYTVHCKDGTDELGCTCEDKPEFFKCATLSKCVPRYRLCDGKDDCGDSSDEANCTTCPDGGFLCDKTKCLSNSNRCDGSYVSCKDGSDERNCPICNYTCADGQCLRGPPPTSRFPGNLPLPYCTAKPKCQDLSDVLTCKGSNETFLCANGKKVSAIYRCSGRDICGDNSTEVNCTSCPTGRFRCPSGRCINSNLLCNGKAECSDGSDEANCDHDCGVNTFRCQDDGTCIPDYYKCDGKPQCFDGSDERQCSSCDAPEIFKCQDGMTCISTNFTCDGVNDCGDGSDEANCAICSQASAFRCNNGNCISSKGVCDGNSDCSDGEDEADDLCAEKCKDFSSFKCTDGRQCVSGWKQCDGKDDCKDGSDESNCTRKLCANGQFRCANGICVSKSKRCDGRDNCGDLSDEKECSYCPWRVALRCPDGTCLPLNFTSDAGLYTQQTQCLKQFFKASCNSNGEYCKFVPKNDPRKWEWTCWVYDFEDTALPTCTANDFQCRNKEQCVPVDRLCNGFYDCADLSDEEIC